VRLNPKQSFFYYSRAMAYAGKKDFARARQDLQKSLELKPDHPKADFMKEKIAQWSKAKPLPQTSPLPAAPPAIQPPSKVQSPDWMSTLNQSSPQPESSNSFLSQIGQGSGARMTGTMPAVKPKLAPVAEPTTVHQGSIVMGVVGGVVGGLLGAFIWAGFTALTGIQFGLIAVAIGFLVGLSTRTFGNGNDIRFGAIGAVFAFLGCLVGNMLAIYFMVAKTDAKLAHGLIGRPDVLLQVMGDNFSPIDILFYLIAIYEGFKFSQKPI